MKRIFKPGCIAVLATCLLGCTVQTEANETPLAHDEREQSSNTSSEPGSLVFGDKFPQVLSVKVKPSRNERFRFDVTLSSPYDSRKRYADAWRVLDSQDNELGIRILAHDHASEQPFTRSHTIAIPGNTKWVFVEGRDQANGWSGQRFKVELP